MTTREQPREAPWERSLDTVLDRVDIAERTDEPAPVPDDDGVDLSWARDDAAHAGRVEAAAHGEVTPDEALEDVASSLGYRERSLDEDDYNR